jgi:hypothetical protein
MSLTNKTVCIDDKMVYAIRTLHRSSRINETTLTTERYAEKDATPLSVIKLKQQE